MFKNKKKSIFLLTILLFFISIILCFFTIENIFAYSKSKKVLINKFQLQEYHRITINYLLYDGEKNNIKIQDSLTYNEYKDAEINLSNIIIDNNNYSFKNFEIENTNYSKEDSYIVNDKDLEINEYYYQKYSITYELDGGNLNSENKTTYLMNTEDFTLNNPTKDGYRFLGWEGTDLTDITKEVTISKGSKGDRIYTAKWEKITLFTEHIINLTNNSDKESIEPIGETGLAYDGTIDNNLRYIGASPDNYILFNNELWRIIGVMNNIDDGTGNKESKLKIVRTASLGKYPWNEDGNSNFAKSSLKDVLNSDGFYNSLSEDSKNKISTSVWNLGGFSTWEFQTVYNFYEKERSSNTKENNPLTWTGNVGLIYGSDYGFATSGDEEHSRNACLNFYSLTKYGLNNWSVLSSAYDNNWLSKIDGTIKEYWVMNFDTDTNHIDIPACDGKNVYSYGPPIMPGWTHDVYPTIYLKSNIEIKGGSGTINDPYTIK